MRFVVPERDTNEWPRYVEPQSPPTSYAIAGVLDGEPGAWSRVLYGAAQRAVFLAPGLYLAGVRGKQLVRASILGSASISAMLFPYYMIRKRRTK